MLATLVTVLAETEEPRATLFMPGWLFPLFAFIFFLLAALVSWSFRDVAHRHNELVGDGGADEHAPASGQH